MLRSLIISSMFLGLAGCGTGEMSERSREFLAALSPHCGPASSNPSRDLACDAFIVYAGEPVFKVSGVSINGSDVAPHLTWRDPNSDRVMSLASFSEPDIFFDKAGRVVGPTDHDWPIVKARFLGLEDGPG